MLRLLTLLLLSFLIAPGVSAGSPPMKINYKRSRLVGPAYFRPTNVNYDRSKVLGSYYFESGNSDAVIGIVLIDVPFEGNQAFIGTAYEMTKDDAERAIAEHGSSFPVEVAKSLIR